MLNETILNVLNTYAGRPCFKVKYSQRYQNVSYHRFQHYILRLAKYFTDQGLGPGQRVAVIAENSVEWMATLTAAWFVGAIVIPLRTSLSADLLLYILQDSGAGLVYLQHEGHLKIIADHLARAPQKLPDLSTVVTATSVSTVDLPLSVVTIDTVLNSNQALTQEERQHIETMACNVSPDSLATIFYITTETGQLTGAQFTHQQTLTSLHHVSHWFSLDPDDVGFTVRPWSESASLATALHYLISGVPNALVHSHETISENMQQTSPTVMLDIPHMWEQFYEGYMSWLTRQPESSQEVFKWAIAKAKEFRAAGPAASPELRQEYDRADMTFFSEFRGKIGGRMRRLYSAGASLPQELADFFEAIGLPIVNVYSLTEAGGFPAVNHLGIARPGSCGTVVPGFEIAIGKDSEVLIKGETVVKAYWRKPDAAKTGLTSDGWLHTGDIGHFDDDGYLYVTSRKHHVMVLSTGRKISPSALENALTASPFIAQAAIFGEGKPYVSAMIVPNLQTLSTYFKDDGEVVASTGHPRVKALLDEVIGEVNSHLDQWEQVREYNLLDQPLRQDTGELTPSMKVSRHVVAERYAAQIEAMYPIAMQLDTKQVTQVQIDPERLRELLEKENLLDAWMADAGIEFLFDLARGRQIDAPSMVHICDTAASIAQMENEEKPLSTAIIVGDPIRIGRILPESQVQLLAHDHIRRMRKTLVTLAKMVDGLVLGYVVDKYGYVRGVHKLEITLDQDPSYLGPQFRHHAAISKQCQAVVFFVPAGGRQVRVFADGKLVGRYANGDWSPDKAAHVDAIIAELAEQKGYNLSLIQRILRCAFQMSEQNLGAIWLLGNASSIMNLSDASEFSSFATLIGASIVDLSDRELINFAKQDGATVIDTYGRFRGCMVLLRPGAGTEAEIGPGKGARHSSAAKMSAETNALAITVSQDGPITVYDNGHRVLSL